MREAIVCGLTAACLCLCAGMYGQSEKPAPKYYIDGKEASKSECTELFANPSRIKNMEILKNETAKEQYNSPNGVVLISTK